MQIESGCPAGWYVRPAQPGYETQTSPNAAYFYYDEKWVYHVAADDGVSGTVTPNPHQGNIFDRLLVSFYNSSLESSHPASITFWCDAVPTWYTTASTTDRPAATTAGEGIGPVPPSCYYCAQNSQLINYGTNLALDPSTASDGAPVQVATPNGGSNQNWYLQGQSGGSVFENGTATFGLWHYSTLLSTAVGVVGADPTWASASDEPPTGGRFYYVDRGAGQVNGTVQLISTSTNLCLASPSSAGQQAVMTTCDATDPAQWWYDKAPV